MGTVRELRMALTVADYEASVAFYRDALGLAELEIWESEDGHGTLLEAGRATIELIDERHAQAVDEIEVGRRVAGPIRLALEVDDSGRAPSGSPSAAPRCWAARWRLPGGTETSDCRRRTGCS